MTDLPEVGADTDPEVQEGIFSRKFWKRAIERAIKTLAQAAALIIIAVQTGTVDMDAEKWAIGLACAFLLSIATSVISSPFGKTGMDDPSLVK